MCGNCNVTYYGKTERHLNVILSEEIGISHLAEKRVECKPFVVSDRLLLHNHDGNFNDFIVLCPDNNGFRLLLKESILILRINYNTASIPLFDQAALLPMVFVNF